MARKNSVYAQGSAQAPDFSEQMTTLVNKSCCDAINRSDTGGYSATIVHRQGFLLSNTVTYDNHTPQEWQDAMDPGAQQVLAQLASDMGAGTVDRDPGNGPITTGTIKVESAK